MRTMAAFLFGFTAFAQQFDVVSIKPASPGGRGMFIRSSPGGRINVSNMPLKEMIILAYRIQPYQISGGPSWIESARFDIEAKPESAVKQNEMQPMLQALLADRFQLKIRRETKELPVYALVLARKDGKLGPKLVEPKEGSCIERDPNQPGPPPDPSQRNCGAMRMGPNQLYGVSIALDFLTQPLSRTLQRTVINRTGLTGKYDITLEWTPDEAQFAGFPPDMPRPTFDPNGPSLFTAIQEQLGLKLDPQKGPVEIFVIERVEKPAEN